MRRSSLISAMLLIFCTFTFLGFRTANLTSTLELSDQTAVQSTRNNRVILVHVDNLQADRPVLKSVWVGVLFNSENQAVLSFVPIYPAEGDRSAAEALANSFKLDRSGKPAASFWRRLASLNIERDGYILADDYALQEIAGWINRQGSLIYGASSPNSSTTPGEWFLELGCGSIGKTGGNIAEFSWSSLGDHIQTDLTGEALDAEWNKLTTPGQPLKCEIVCE
ncbi:MAG: hypothetical protein JW987_14490 [Anaerolineaceae bacterium]|nr:hypothetical protein [Anaerolineaceae bacterium]